MSLETDREQSSAPAVVKAGGISTETGCTPTTQSSGRHPPGQAPGSAAPQRPATASHRRWGSGSGSCRRHGSARSPSGGPRAGGALRAGRARPPLRDAAGGAMATGTRLPAGSDASRRVAALGPGPAEAPLPPPARPGPARPPSTLLPTCAEQAARPPREETPGLVRPVKPPPGEQVRPAPAAHHLPGGGTRFVHLSCPLLSWFNPRRQRGPRSRSLAPPSLDPREDRESKSEQKLVG